MWITHLHWFRFWIHRDQYRQHRAYLRPINTSDLAAALVPLIDQIVTVRFADVASANSLFAGQRIYSIVTQGTSAQTFVRPECDFDFLE